MPWSSLSRPQVGSGYSRREALPREVVFEIAPRQVAAIRALSAIGQINGGKENAPHLAARYIARRRLYLSDCPDCGII